MSVFGVRNEFSDVNTPKTSISASTGSKGVLRIILQIKGGIKDNSPDQRGY